MQSPTTCTACPKFQPVHYKQPLDIWQCICTHPNTQKEQGHLVRVLYHGRCASGIVPGDWCGFKRESVEDGDTAG